MERRDRTARVRAGEGVLALTRACIGSVAERIERRGFRADVARRSSVPDVHRRLAPSIDLESKNVRSCIVTRGIEVLAFLANAVVRHRREDDAFRIDHRLDQPRAVR